MEVEWEWNKEKSNILKKEGKVMNYGEFGGQYVSQELKQRLEKSDLIIWLDYSTCTQLKGVVKRFLKNPGKEK